MFPYQHKYSSVHQCGITVCDKPDGRCRNKQRPVRRYEGAAEQKYFHSSCDPSDHTPSKSSSAFCNTGLEHGHWRNPTMATGSQQTAAQRRPRSNRDGRLGKGVQTKRQDLEGGHLVQEERRVSSPLEDQAQVKEEDLVLKTELQNSEESGSEDEELNRNKKSSYIYHHTQPGLPPALHANLYMCIPCAKGFPSSEQLVAHAESHTAQERSLIKAEDQDSENLSSQSTEDEAKTDVSPARHACSVCGQTCVDVALLRQHERSHWLSRPFSCGICRKPFTQRGTMTRHMRSHLGLKPFACDECGMRFTRQYRRMEHMRVHSREKPYECQLCGAKFTRQRSIIGHLKTHTRSPEETRA